MRRCVSDRLVIAHAGNVSERPGRQTKQAPEQSGGSGHALWMPAPPGDAGIPADGAEDGPHVPGSGCCTRSSGFPGRLCP